VTDARRLARLSNEVAVVGVGDTDYPADYRTPRVGEEAPDRYALAATALRRALADAGLAKGELDGLIVGPPLAYERAAEVLGIEPRFGGSADAVGAVVEGVLAITSGLASTVALVYGNDQRTVGTAYGGPNAMGGEGILSYVYYAPWGMTSQGALYALMTQRYLQLHGLSSADIGQVAVAERQFAQLNPNAIMRQPITIDDYLAARFIAEPLRLYDYCLINDGGVALILTTKERAARATPPQVTVAGLGRADEKGDATSLRPRLISFYHQGHKAAAEQVYDAAGVSPGDIDVLSVYDSFSCHVLYALEGFGFCAEGEAPAFIREKGIGPGGTLPVNTAGGHLSESYMQGWGHQVEAVRQARGACGPRQVPDARHVQYISDVAGSVVSIIYRGGS
jgi:acetyl-CoA acetyltransferase